MELFQTAWNTETQQAGHVGYLSKVNSDSICLLYHFISPIVTEYNYLNYIQNFTTFKFVFSSSNKSRHGHFKRFIFYYSRFINEIHIYFIWDNLNVN